MWEPMQTNEEAVTPEEAIGQALGSASMCWDPKPSSQVFDSQKCEDVLDGLMHYLRTKAA